MKFPKTFIDTIINAWGSKGEIWFKELPDLITYCQEKWSLYNLKLVDNLSFNCVFTANRKNEQALVILKLSIPSPEFSREMHALQIYHGQGAVKLLEIDLAKGACILEALLPGHTLESFFPAQDEKATLLMLEVMQKLHACKLPEDLSGFQSITQWLSVLNNIQEAPFLSLPLIKKARNLASHLLETSQEPAVLLHGDLHHENILLNHQEWTAIDPKGVIGERAYEVGSFIRNPMPELLQQVNALDIINKRLELCSKYLNIEKSRLVDWCFVQAVLSACWAYEDKSDWGLWLKCAELIERLLKE